MERLANAYGSECNRVRQDLAIAESQLHDYQARLGKPFLYDAYLSELAGLRDQLKAGLSGTTQLEGEEPDPSVSDIAEKIRALKTTQSIEATPQCARQKHISAEEPVTARIRRRTQQLPPPDPAIGSDAASPEGPDLPPESDQNSSRKPSVTHQERIAMERHQKETPENLL